MYEIITLLLSIFIDVVVSQEYALQVVGANDAKMLASIRFENATTHLCLGVILGRRTVMTSAPCINSYIPIYSMLQYDFEKGKCMIIFNSREEGDTNNTEQRSCQKFEMNNQTWWSYGKQVFYEYPVNILVNLPMNNNTTERMDISEPKLKGFDLCKVYGWEIPPEGSKKELLSTVAMLMDQYKCIDMYKDRISSDFPENQFCVVETRIQDEGRIVVCDRKLLGIFTRKMPNLHGNEAGNVNLYTFASSGQRSNLTKNSFSNYLHLLIKFCQIMALI